MYSFLLQQRNTCDMRGSVSEDILFPITHLGCNDNMGIFAGVAQMCSFWDRCL